MNKQGLKIMNINGAEVLKLQKGKKAEIKWNGVFPNSMLLDKLKSMGLEISKQGSAKQIIGVSFDYGYTDDGFKELENAEKELKKDLRKNKSNNNKSLKRIQKLTVMLEKSQKELKLFEEQINNLINEKDKKKIQAKINTRYKKIDKIYEELSTLSVGTDMVEESINSRLDDIYISKKEKIYKVDKLRDKLYNEGFSLNTYKTIKGEKVFDKTIKYKFWFRSPSKCKGGECIFIDEKLYDKIYEWQTMGIKLKEDENGNVMLVELNAYMSLVSSHIEEYIDLSPDEILVLKDLDTYSEEKEIVEILRDKVTGYSKAEHKKARLKDTIWDGMSLMEGIKGFKVLRNHFFKTCAFGTKIQLFFKDYYGDKYDEAEIIDMFGRRVKVKNIKLITTDNSLKWIKFLGETKEGYEYWSKKIIEDGNKFGVCKHDHKSKYGKVQRMSYQMINTLLLKKEDMDELFKETEEYIMNLKNNTEAMNRHFLNTKSNTNINELLVDICNKNKDFYKSNLYKEARKQEIKAYKNSLKKGKLVVEGDNLTVVSNPLLLLDYSVGKLNNYINNGILSDIEDRAFTKRCGCYTLQFKDGEEIGAFRNPHNSILNCCYFENEITDVMNRYFDFGINVIATNTVYSGLEERANSMDFDSDFMMCTKTKIISNSCKKAQEYPTILNSFEKSKKTYKNTMSDLAIIDNGLAKSQLVIGTSSNVAQLCMTQYWDKMYHINNIIIGEDTDEEYINYLKSKANKLFDDVSILSVLAQVAIDNCKRQFEVGNGDNGLAEEIERIRNELPNKAKPVFWQYTSSAFNKSSIEKALKNKRKKKGLPWNSLLDSEKRKLVEIEYKNKISKLYNYECPMDWIQENINNIKYADRIKPIKDEMFIQLIGTNRTQNRKQATKIEEIILELDDITKFINTDGNLEDESNLDYYNFIYNEYLDKLIGMKIRKDTMSLLIARTLMNENKYMKSNSKIKSKLLNMLYKYNKNNFLECFLSK